MRDLNEPLAEYSKYLTCEIYRLERDKEKFWESKILSSSSFEVLSIIRSRIDDLKSALNKFYSLFPEVDPQRQEKEGQLAQKADTEAKSPGFTQSFAQSEGLPTED